MKKSQFFASVSSASSLSFKGISGSVVLLSVALLASCKDDDNNDPQPKEVDPTVAAQYYTGGELGTSFLVSSSAYEQPTPVVDKMGLSRIFLRGEKMFEKPFTANHLGGEREGLGPLYLRTSCLHCHPGYGHGQSQPDGMFHTNEVGNGYLLVVYNPDNDAYVTWLAGMPQGHAVAPFKSPLDESKIALTWHDYTDHWNNTFPDGETYSLRYPEVELPREAVYVINQGYEDATTNHYEVRLESTIGIYGTGLLDAIPDDSITAQWAKEENAFKRGFIKDFRTGWFADGQWQADGGAYYTNKVQGDGSPHVRRYTYAMSRGPLMDAAGTNAIWNITNVTRSDRRYHYLDLNGKIYATYASKDPEVQAGFPDYIRQVTTAEEHPEFFTANVEENIFNYLTSKNLPAEMSDDDYIAFAVWHRGLAVPAARNIEDDDIQEGRRLFTQIGCAQCHRPSWTTGDDEVYDPNLFTVQDAKSPYFGKTLASLMPRYPKQTIWPYTDMVQHKLYMKNDIRTGWCRTTPLWGRGLHQTCSGSPYADRLHDCRARNVVEAIMWHAANEGGTSDATRAVEGFRNLSKEERAKLVAFVDAI